MFIIASLALSVDIIIVILWAAWLRKDHPGFINVPTLLINLVSVAVAFIPEGLPVCVTLSLTVIASKMKNKSTSSLAARTWPRRRASPPGLGRAAPSAMSLTPRLVPQTSSASRSPRWRVSVASRSSARIR